MLYKDVEDCKSCPLQKHDICPNSWGGSTLSAPCPYFEGDTDLDKWINNFFDDEFVWEDPNIRLLKEEVKRQKREKLAMKKRKEEMEAVWDEIQEIKLLRTFIHTRQTETIMENALIYELNPTHKAVNVHMALVKLEQENEKYYKRIAELEAIKKEKLKQLRKQRSEKNETL